MDWYEHLRAYIDVFQLGLVLSFEEEDSTGSGVASKLLSVISVEINFYMYDISCNYNPVALKFLREPLVLGAWEPHISCIAYSFLLLTNQA